MRIRHRVLLVMGGVLTIVSLGFTLVVAKLQHDTLTWAVNRELTMAALAAKDVLPPGYHDGIVDRTSVSTAQYDDIVDRFNRICRAQGLEYLWSLMVLDGQTVFTSATSPSKDVRRGDHARFLEAHSNPDLYTRAFATMQAQSQINDDKWGRIQAVLIPFRDSHGRPYLVGASRSVRDVQALFRENLLHGTLASIALVLLAALASFILAGALARPVESVTRAAVDIAAGDLDSLVAIDGPLELAQLGGSLNTLSHAIRTRLGEVEAGRERLRITLESIGDGVIATDADGHVTQMNDAAEHLTGWTDGEAVGRSLTEVLRVVEANGGQPMPDPVAIVLGRGGTVQLADNAVVVSREGGERSVSGSAAPIRDRAGQLVGVVLVLRDTTERLALEAQLRQAQKMESVGRLAGGVAHDYNNMLQVILGHVNLLLEAVDEQSSMHEDLTEIHVAAQRSADLTRQLLAFARRQAVSPRVLDLNALVAGMERMLRRLIGENIDLVWRPAPDLWPVRQDPSQIDQTLVNLVVNARDAIGGRGAIIVETDNVTLDEAYCAVVAEAKAGDYVRLSVSDNGQGMSAEAMAHIFEPFYTTKQLGQGTGLGLATVYGIAMQSGGFIHVYSEVGRGSTFRVFLPAVRDAEAQTLDAAVSGPLDGNETILLVEDEEAVQRVGWRILAQHGYEVLAAASAEAALALAADYQGAIALLITDAVMPGLSGFQLRDVLAKQRPTTHCLVMSGYAPEVVIPAGADGAHFIAKPFSSRDLLTKVREVLDS